MITQVQLNNFRSHVLTNIMLANFNLFLGPMGAGKSSVLHAIAMALLGQDPLVNSRGEGLVREIRSGEKEFHVGVKMDPGGVIDRKFAEGRHSVGIDGSYAGVKQQQGRILERLGCSEDVILALLDPTPFFSRDEKAQRKVLLQFMANKEIAAPELIRKLGLAESFQSVGQIDLLIKEVKESKVRDLNREIDTLQKQIPEPVTFDPGQKKALDKKLLELRPQRDDLIRKQSREEEWRRTIDSLKANLVTVQKEGSLLDLEKNLAEATKREAESRKELLAKKKEYQDISAKEKEVGGEKTTWEADLAHQEATLKAIGEMGAKCGVVAKFDCPLKDADKKKMHRQLEDDVKETKDGLEVLRSESTDVAQKLADIEATGKALSATIEGLATNKSSLASKVARLMEAVGRLSDHESKPPATGEWTEDLKKVAEQIADAEIDLANVTKAEEEVSRRSIQVANVKAKQAQAEALKSAAEELAKLKEGLLEQASGGFVKAMQGFLSNFGFQEVEFRSDPFGFVVDGLYADQLSGGQKVVFEAALRLAAAKSSGLNVMALDDANKLGEKSRQKLAGLLAGAGIQAVVCSTTEIEPAPTALPQGMALYWFSNPSVVGPTTVKKLG